jgi:DNA-binding FadR family transcriptional regulator
MRRHAEGTLGTELPVADRILAQVQHSGLGPGGRLPTERELAADLGVTRTAVRHALASIEAAGQISREVGRGTFLRRPQESPGGTGADATAAPPDDVGPADVMAVRRLLEPPAMTLVVAWATARDLVEMQRCLDGGATAQTYEEFEVWDLALHRCVIAASHSKLLMRMYAVVEASRQGQMWGDLKRRSDSLGRRQRYQDDHRILVDALRARDSEAAVQAMRTHLDRVAENLLGGTH